MGNRGRGSWEVHVAWIVAFLEACLLLLGANHSLAVERSQRESPAYARNEPCESALTVSHVRLFEGFSLWASPTLPEGWIAPEDFGHRLTRDDLLALDQAGFQIREDSTFSFACEDFRFCIGFGVPLTEPRPFAFSVGGHLDIELSDGSHAIALIRRDGRLAAVLPVGADGRFSFIAARSLLTTLQRLGLMDRFFRRNPFPEAEEKVRARLASSEVGVSIPELSLDAVLNELLSPSLDGSPSRSPSRSKDELVLLVGDVHTSLGGENRVKALLRQSLAQGGPAWDWIALEMLPAELQPQLDRYLKSDPSSLEWNAARKALIKALHRYSWGRWKPEDVPTTLEILELVREINRELAEPRRIRVYGVDAPEPVYQLYRRQVPGEHHPDNRFYMSLRNAIWAENVPRQGRGLVFGGQAHFFGVRNTNFQDFYAPSSGQMFMLEKLP